MDIYPQGALQVKVKRSPFPHALIKSIDISRAHQLAGVVDIITAADIPATRYGQAIYDQEILASNKVRFAGDPVAAVAATSLETAEEALELIDVEYEQLPAVLDPEEALSKNPPAVVHPDLLSYDTGLDVRLSSLGWSPETPNVCAHFKVRQGDVKKGFARSDMVVENRFTTQMMHAVPLEPYVSVSQVASDGTLEVYTSTQFPFSIREKLSKLLNIPTSRVRVLTPNVGGAFGCKLEMKVEPICCLLALRTKRPVRLQFTREETFVCGSVRHPFIIYLKDGVSKDGFLKARQIRAILDGGAYGGHGISVAKSAIYGASENYKVENFRLDTYRVYTNKPHGGAFRGFGCAQLEWAIESQMDILAEKLGMDKVEFRLKNILRPGDVNVIGEKVSEDTARACLTEAARAIEWNQPKPPSTGAWKKGKGIAIGSKYSRAPSTASVEVRIWPEGYVEVVTGAVDMGQGTFTALAQMAAEEFRIPLDKVVVVSGDTHITPRDEGAYSNRQIYNTGNALLLACRDAKRQIFERASKLLDVDPENLNIEDGVIYRKDDRSISVQLKSLYRRSTYSGYVPQEGGEIVGKASWFSSSEGTDPETGQVRGEKANSFYTYSAVAVELEVNEETGQVRVIRIIGAVDVGKPVNLLGVEGQIEGCIGMGLGTSLLEELVVEEGNVLNADFLNYKVPTSLEAPQEMRTIIVDNTCEKGPYGAKGAGETAITAVPPAIANAIYDAVGARIRDLPITPHRILKGLGKGR